MISKLKAGFFLFCVKTVENKGYTVVRIVRRGNSQYIVNADGQMTRIGRR